MTLLRLSAPWVIPVAGDPIAGGAVLVADDGRVAAVGPDGAVATPPGCPRRDYVDAVIMPGLINAHTHLELTGLNGGRALEAPDFPSWIGRLRTLKGQWSPTDFAAAAREGLRQCAAAGVTTIAETGDSGVVPGALERAGLRGVVYHEVFGPHPGQVDASVAGLAAQMAALQATASERVRLGVSPHAPYTVSGPLYREVTRWARERGLPLAVHIAESADETALVGTASGAFAERWRERGVPLPEPQGLSPLTFLAHWGVLDRAYADVLAIHAVQVHGPDLALMARARVGVAHCPLANRAHGHGHAPLAGILASGVSVGIGTDSELSVGRIDLLAAARAAQGLVDAAPEDVVRWLTAGAAAALAWPGLGTLISGSWADLAVFPLRGLADPHAAIIDTRSPTPLSTFVAGRSVWERGD